ncbi:MAG: carbamoyltransferase HypF [Oscillatoriales cyanobacterium RM2_1_1]|nr:carbamoyltransferase HypF [Oscillatoriales cyanobacterium SM2_3_0]NJO47427.1 carbamoyltransferase HypF [Oscillatoriales cyanobacterium RM2_1_1]
MSTTVGVAETIRVRGLVQGVGFRPLVYRLAQIWNLTGEVLNDGEGVLIRLRGDRPAIDQFLQQLQAQPPPLARIDSVQRYPDSDNRQFSSFTIGISQASPIRTEISPDAATCPECLREILDPQSRWYRYPLTNCTYCGPRLSLIRRLPYDRENTSMARFALCPRCQQDYGDPANRRFHAQPTACPVCGPQVWLESADGNRVQPQSISELDSELDPVKAVCRLIQQGKIIAIKGLGGFHLACDATNPAAVQRLRDRKHRPDKPLALMARNLKMIQQYCQVNPPEQALLESAAAPIVLLQRWVAPLHGDQVLSRKNLDIAPAVAPMQNSLGFMLPHTPLHHLIVQDLDIPIVLTSGNLSDQPQCIDNATACQTLSNIADYLLLHDRDIINRVDDSIVRWRGKPLQTSQILRRARGYAPAPISLPAGFELAPSILAMGSELKNTFCLLQGGRATLSQHLGDLGEASVAAAYQQTLKLYLGLLEHSPQGIVIDRHPDYLSTKLGQALAQAHDIPLEFVQHHHAHIGACMAENDLPLETQPILGIALDGLGYGEDHTLWGGEFLLADYRGFRRLGTFKPVAMLGGAQAIYQPWRSAYAHLRSAGFRVQNSGCESLLGSLKHPNNAADLFEFFQHQPLKLLDQMLEQGINSPLASSCGRLFDAVAAAIGVCRGTVSYEGQGAIALESLAERHLLNHSEEMSAYPFSVITVSQVDSVNPGSKCWHLDSALMWGDLIQDLAQNTEQTIMAARFHRGLAQAIAEMVERIRGESQFDQVALSGGVFQNQILLTQVQQHLISLGFQVLTHSQVPSNDGGLSLGQAVIAAARMGS